jgi:uncharacterized protein YggE
MDTKPDTIRIAAMQREEVPATHADLFVTVKGSSLVNGKEALKKAKEVKELVEGLTGAGVAMADIHLQSIHTETSSGAVLKSSSASYGLRVRCNKLEQIPDLLGVVADQKNATFERVDWKYPDDEALEKGFTAAIAKAQSRAEKAAAALGVKLLGIHSFEGNLDDEEGPSPMRAAAPMARSRAVGVVPPSAELGMDIQHIKNVRYSVEIEYRVSGFDDE